MPDDEFAHGGKLQIKFDLHWALGGFGMSTEIQGQMIELGYLDRGTTPVKYRINKNAYRFLGEDACKALEQDLKKSLYQDYKTHFKNMLASIAADDAAAAVDSVLKRAGP